MGLDAEACPTGQTAATAPATHPLELIKAAGHKKELKPFDVSDLPEIEASAVLSAESARRIARELQAAVELAKTGSYAEYKEKEALYLKYVSALRAVAPFPQ